MPSRRGRKSAAQTPAPKAERIYGSKKNPAGSADTGKSVVLSDKTTKTLKNKFEEFRKKYPKKKNITFSDVKAVYRRGSGAYSKSHRPTITGGKPNSRAAWSFARVNKFLKKAAGEKVKAAYVQDDDLLKKDGGVLAEGGNPFNDKELLEKYNAGESIGFTATAHLKAKGLIPRADGTKRKSDKYLENGGDIKNPLLEEGKKYFPKLKEIDGRYYLNYPKNKGSFSENGFKNHLVNYKIEKVLEWIKAKNINYSKSTQSVYFTLNGKEFRVSDHKKKSFEGIDITIKWNTPIEDIMQSKTLYHGSPYEFTEFSELNIGTGEGNQKYGRGFYFTESPEVAERYSLVPSDNSLYINGIKLKDETNLSDNDKMTILSIWREKWEEGYSETKEDYISEILYELQKRSDGISKEVLTQQFGEDFFSEEEMAEINANVETYKRLNEYLANANLEIKSYIYEVKLITNNLYFADDETEETDESYDGLYYNYPYQDGIKNYVIFSSKNFYIISKKSFKMGGTINQQIECVGCGWKWNTADSDDSDMYVCHQCGFDNSLFYETANILKPTLTIEQIADKHNVNVGYIENQLDKGIEHELEHTDNQNVAEKIALHHLAETPDYYEKLAEMNLEDGGLTINAEPVDYQQYLIEQKKEAEDVLMCTDTRIFKMMICKSKIELAEKNMEATDIPLEKIIWNECRVIWKNCMKNVEKNKIPQMKEGGQPCGCGKIYAKGGLAYGNSHDKGGMPMTVKSTGQNIEIEGGEGVVNKRSMQMTKKLNFEGKRLTPCEVISKINQMGGGVKFKCDDVKEIIDADGSF